MTVDELTQHMDSSLFVADLKAKKKDAALEELTDALVAGSGIKDRDLVLEMFRNREQLGSTAVGKGVAFPHGRTLAVKELTILVARSPKGVDFESLDGDKTRLFFVLVAPPQDDGNYYLQALGKIIELVQKDESREALLGVDSFDSLLNILRESA